MLFGSATYPLYLLHHNIGFIVFNYVGDTINKYAVLTATIAAMIFLSIFISHYLEPHIRERVRNSLAAVIKILSQIATRQELSF